MSELKTEEIERAIQNAQLVEIWRHLEAQINVSPSVLEHGAQVLPEGSTVYGYAPTRRNKYESYSGDEAKRKASVRERFLTVEEPYAKAPQAYDGATRERHWPELETITKAFNDYGFPTTLSPLMVYCSKTGQPIAPIAEDTLHVTMQVHGREALQKLLYYGNGNAVHTAWLKTADCTQEQYNVILDRLCELTPQAYASYCLGLIALNWTKQKDCTSSKRDLGPDAQAEYHWSLARAYQILGFMSPQDLATLCDELCHILHYAPSSLRSLNRYVGSRIKLPDAMAKLAFAKELLPTIGKALDHTFTSIAEYQRAIDRAIREDKPLPKYEDKLRSIGDAARGPSHLGKTRKARDQMQSDEIKAAKRSKNAEVNEAMELLEGFYETTKVNLDAKSGAKFRTTMGRRADRNEVKPLPASNLSVEAAIEDVEEIDRLAEEDDTTETRSITWAALALEQEEKRFEEQAAKAQKTKVSITIKTAPKPDFVIVPPAPKAEPPKSRFGGTKPSSIKITVKK